MTTVFTSVLILSIVLNLYLGAIVYSMYAGPSELVYREGDPEYRVVILPVDGAIGDATASQVRRSLRSLEANPPAAIVLRVTSPGGGITASDQIWHHLKSFRAVHPEVPVVASFGSVSASGGYYVSTPCDFIMAETTTITGSIGVIATGFTISGMLDKIGVTPEIIASTNSTDKDTGSMYRPWTEQDRDVIRGLLDSGYERFIAVVAEGRDGVLTEDEVRELATGQIFMAQEALDAKLVDGIGYLTDAIDKAVELARVPSSVDPAVMLITEPEGFSPWSLLWSSGPDPESLLTMDAGELRAALLELGMPEVSYRAPLALPGE
ncbi:Putative signal peptide peptidase SppA [Mucisphaera calidilacus]|uniref:Signal peptide peptidase SppA n=2 Tax=Mucisphaera calidilacus TaxID=2527982 RepID=A0A518BY41_9BACT|nr:Putative signal peptide peptidase SppA [Mucisphaera calidilacus]